MSSASQFPHFLQPLAASTSTSVGAKDAYFQHSARLGNAKSHCLWWPNISEQQISSIILFVPGNPGLADFYVPFLTHINQSYESSAILALSLVGHSPKVGSIPHAYCGLQYQIEAIVEAIDIVRDNYPPSVNLILIGHSVGAWIVLQALKERDDVTRAAFLLFPTITHIAKTPNGKRLSWLFRSPARDIVSQLSRILHVVPKSLIAHLFSDWPAEQFDILWGFLKSPTSIINSLSMADEEMQSIREVDVSLLDAVKHKLYFYLAEKDDWVGENKQAILREMADEPHSVRVVHGCHGIPHAYCINHGRELADECLRWLAEAN